jgi:hypothetical protein
MSAQYVTDNFPTVKEAWPVMPADAYIGLSGEVARTIEPHTESDPVALLLQFLAFFGSKALPPQLTPPRLKGNSSVPRRLGGGGDLRGC